MRAAAAEAVKPLHHQTLTLMAALAVVAML